MESLMRMCPNCKKVSYASWITWYSNCPNCGFDLSKWFERRSNKRVTAEHQTTIIYHGDIYYGHTVDLSETGVKIIYKGKAFDTGARLDIAIENSQKTISATAVWSKQVSGDTSHAGVRLI